MNPQNVLPHAVRTTLQSNVLHACRYGILRTVQRLKREGYMVEWIAVVIQRYRVRKGI